MIKRLEAVLLSSEDSTKLAKFYREVVGFNQTMEFEMGENGELGYAFEDVQLYINPHSQVHGKNKNPERYMLNFEVEDIEEEVNRLKKHKVKVIANTYHIEGYGLIATFEDVDGNYFQLVQVRPASN